MYSLDDIRRRMRSHNPDDRRVAMVMAAKARQYELVDNVISALQHDSDDEVRAMAAWSLDLMGSVEAIPVLVKAMYDSDFGVRSNAGWALVHLAQRIMAQLVVPEVIDVLKDKEHERAREMAYLVLSNINDETARNALKSYW